MVVIPAEAGIHLDSRLLNQKQMDSRFRGNDANVEMFPVVALATTMRFRALARIFLQTS